MTTTENLAAGGMDKMQANLQRVEALTERLISVMQTRKPVNPVLNGPGPELFAKAMAAYWTEIAQNPHKIFEHQLGAWGEAVTHFVEGQQAIAAGGEAPEAEGARDPRFANPLWRSNPYFNFVKESYAFNAKTIRQAVADVTDLEPTDKKRLDFFSEQIINLMSPSNFLATNPDALEKAVETEGESLVKGLENLISDLEANDGELLVKLADDRAFELGRNVATSEGSVVFRNEMLELIQYAPQTQEVYKTPIVLFPPWINKFYILDLKAQNSLIKWVVEQGYTLFVVSWRNPGRAEADWGMGDYIENGFLEAIRVAKQITGEKTVNVVGYCIAGTTLNLTLAYLKAKGDKSVKSATFFTALTDFSDQGEFTPFLQNEFVDGIEEEVAKYGVMRSVIMSRTMSYLRSNDLIYGPAVKSYMMGETPPAFDLLFWNGDSTNLPAKMTVEYLRELCQRNAFIEGGYELLGERLHIGAVDVPLCAVTCETDHIAPWRACYTGFGLAASKDKTFIVSQSGHVAGIVNPPAKKKYGHYVNEALPKTADAWWEGAEFTEGSWWPRWEAWLKPRSGKTVKARQPGGKGYAPICDAPGTYVKLKPEV